MARHLCFERAYLDQLLRCRRAGAGMQTANSHLDSNRRRYILHLRELRRRSPKSEADAELQRSKSRAAPNPHRRAQERADDGLGMLWTAR